MSTQREQLRRTAKANGWNITEREERNETRYARKGIRIVVRWQYDTASHITRNGEFWMDSSTPNRGTALMFALEAPVDIPSAPPEIPSEDFYPGHVPLPAVQLNYPGGKDGMWRAGCLCGYRTGYAADCNTAELDVTQHLTASQPELPHWIRA